MENNRWLVTLEELFISSKPVFSSIKIYINTELKEGKDANHLTHNFLVLWVLSIDIKCKSLWFLNFKLSLDWRVNV